MRSLLDAGGSVGARGYWFVSPFTPSSALFFSIPPPPPVRIFLLCCSSQAPPVCVLVCRLLVLVLLLPFHRLGKRNGSDFFFCRCSALASSFVHSSMCMPGLLEIVGITNIFKLGCIMGFNKVGARAHRLTQVCGRKEARLLSRGRRG